MPQSIPPGLTQEHVLQALKDLDSGIDHPFGAPTGYELVHDGKRYAPKAVVGSSFGGRPPGRGLPNSVHRKRSGRAVISRAVLRQR